MNTIEWFTQQHAGSLASTQPHLHAVWCPFAVHASSSPATRTTDLHGTMANLCPAHAPAPHAIRRPFAAVCAFRVAPLHHSVTRNTQYLATKHQVQHWATHLPHLQMCAPSW